MRLRCPERARRCRRRRSPRWGASLRELRARARCRPALRPSTATRACDRDRRRCAGRRRRGRRSRRAAPSAPADSRSSRRPPGSPPEDLRSGVPAARARRGSGAVPACPESLPGRTAKDGCGRLPPRADAGSQRRPPRCRRSSRASTRRAHAGPRRRRKLPRCAALRGPRPRSRATGRERRSSVRAWRRVRRSCAPAGLRRRYRDRRGFESLRSSSRLLAAQRRGASPSSGRPSMRSRGRKAAGIVEKVSELRLGALGETPVGLSAGIWAFLSCVAEELMRCHH